MIKELTKSIVYLDEFQAECKSGRVSKQLAKARIKVFVELHIKELKMLADCIGKQGVISDNGD